MTLEPIQQRAAQIALEARALADRLGELNPASVPPMAQADALEDLDDVRQRLVRAADTLMSRIRTSKLC
jgi:hypothetical protein